MMIEMMTTRGMVGSFLIALVVTGAPLGAQLPQASAAALGMGYNTTASPRGFAAVANNPAGLGLPGSPGFSLAIPGLVAEAGFGPITLGDLVDWERRTVPVGVKEEWLARVVESGGQGGESGAAVTAVALNVGSVGLQISSRAGGAVAISPDAVELVLFGNAGRTGTERDFDLTGSTFDGYAMSTAALSWGFQASRQMYLGVTGSYSIGSGLVVGRDGGSLLRSSPLSIEVDFPMLVPSEDWSFNNGSGLGLDVGAVWVGPRMTVGATIQNIVNTFEWNLDGYSYVAGVARYEQGDSQSDFDEQPADDMPQSFRDIVEGLTPKPAFAVGIEMSPSPILRLAADVRKRSAEGLVFGPEFHLGVGAELRAISFLPLRTHLNVVTGGMQIGGGASLVLGPVNLSGGIARRSGDFGAATLGMLTLSFGGS